MSFMTVLISPLRLSARALRFLLFIIGLLALHVCFVFFGFGEGIYVHVCSLHRFGFVLRAYYILILLYVNARLQLEQKLLINNVNFYLYWPLFVFPSVHNFLFLQPYRVYFLAFPLSIFFYFVKFLSIYAIFLPVVFFQSHF